MDCITQNILYRLSTLHCTCMVAFDSERFRIVELAFTVSENHVVRWKIYEFHVLSVSINVLQYLWLYLACFQKYSIAKIAFLYTVCIA